MKASEIVKQLKEDGYKVSVHPSVIELAKEDSKITAYFQGNLIQLNGMSLHRAVVALFGYDYPLSAPLSVPNILMHAYLDQTLIEWDL